MAGRGCGGRIARVGSGHDVEGGGEIGDVTSHRSHGVEGQREGDNAAATVEAERGLEAGDAIG